MDTAVRENIGVTTSDNGGAGTLSPSDANLRVLIVAENASERFGGEAILPLHYFRELNARGAFCKLIVHARVRDELIECIPQWMDRVEFVEDSALHKLFWQLGRIFPERISVSFTSATLGFFTAVAMRRMAKRVVVNDRIDIVHQPTPVSPKAPSLLFGLGAPVVIGPMNGGMKYPSMIADRYESWITRCLVGVLRLLCEALNLLLPGKRTASLLLVANERTRVALPRFSCRRAKQLVENGIVVAPETLDCASARADGETKFVFAGRLIDWKGVDLLIRAFAKMPSAEPSCRLEIIGNGPLRSSLEELARELGVSDRVTFAGQLPHRECQERMRACDVFVLPSQLECGGAVVLEAMAAGLPVIATNWGGPADYLTEDCGVLVAPATEDKFIADLATAMSRLADSSEMRKRLGNAAAERVREHFMWRSKIDRIMEFYDEAITAAASPSRV